MSTPDVPAAVRDLIVHRGDGRAHGDDWTETFQDLPAGAGVSIILESVASSHLGR